MKRRGTVGGDGDGQAVRDVRREGRHVRPTERPAVVDGDENVLAGHDAVKNEAAVKIALVAAKEVFAGIGASGYKHDHGCRYRLTVAAREALDPDRGCRDSEVDWNVAAAGDVQPLVGDGLPVHAETDNPQVLPAV